MIEQQVLGCLIRDNSLISQCSLVSTDFQHETNRQVFTEIQKLSIQRKPYDSIILAEHMDAITGGNWLSAVGSMAQSVVAVENFPVYCDLVKHEAVELETEVIGARLQIDHNAGKAITALLNLEQDSVSHDTNIISALTAAVDGIDKAYSGGSAGIKTGITDLDKKLGGLHLTDLVVIAGRPSMGKTSVAMNLVNNIHEPVGVMSAEQCAEQIGQRMIALSGKLSVHKMRNGDIADEDWESLTVAVASLQDRKIFINDKTGMTIEDVQKQARAWKHNNDIKVLFVDYIQKIKGNHPGDKRMDTSDVVIGLKDTAKELNICVVALAQVKREVETRTNNNRPFMSDIAECGIIEQEADQVITLYRDEVYNSESPKQGQLELILCKNRHGPLGTITTTWLADYMQIKDYTEIWGVQ